VEAGYIQEQVVREYTHMYKFVYVCVCGNHVGLNHVPDLDSV